MENRKQNSFIYENKELLGAMYNFNKHCGTIERLKIALDESNRGWENN